MYCKQCGKEIKSTEKFCPYCGAPNETVESKNNKEGSEKKKAFQGKLTKKQKIAGAVGVLLILGIIGSAVEDDGRRGVPDAKDIEKDYKGTLYGSDEEITGSLLLDDETGAESNEGPTYIYVSIEDINRYPEQYMGQYVCVEGRASVMVDSVSIRDSNFQSINLEYESLEGARPLSGDDLMVYGKVIPDSFWETIPAIEVDKMVITSK